MLERLRESLGANLQIRITGSMPERLINLCTMRGILLWGIERKQEAVLAHIRVRDFPQLRPLLKKSGCRVKVMRRTGAPFRMRAVLTRALLLPGLALCLTLLWGFSQFVWDVQITGVQDELFEAVSQRIELYGVAPGTHKQALDLKAIAAQLRLDIPQLRFASLRIEGARLVVEALERFDEPQIITNDQEAVVVATKGGIIEEVVVIRGTAQVKPGDAVREGDILISSLEQSQHMHTRRVFAQGKVTARRWITQRARVDLLQAATKPTGRVQDVWTLCIGLHRWGEDAQPEYQQYQTELKRFQLGLFPPAWLERVRYVETQVDMPSLDMEKIQQVLLEKATEQAMAQVGQQAAVVDKRERFSMIEEGILAVEVSVEIIEDIAQSVPVGQGNQ